MLRSHEIDVVATFVLQIQHHFSKLIRLGGAALAQPTDLVVLAEDATQIGGTKENGPRAARAAQATFLAEVGKITAHNGVSAGLAYLGLIFETVNVAIARAEGTSRPASLGRVPHGVTIPPTPTTSDRRVGSSHA